MAVILRNEFGVVAVNRQVVTKLILDEMLAMEGELLPCTKSGKPLKKSRFSGYGDMTDAIELTDERGDVCLTIYYLAYRGAQIYALSDRLFDRIVRSFSRFSYEKSVEMRVVCKGFLGEVKSKKDGVQKDIVHVRILDPSARSK